MIIVLYSTENVQRHVANLLYGDGLNNRFILAQNWTQRAQGIHNLTQMNRFATMMMIMLVPFGC